MIDIVTRFLVILPIWSPLARASIVAPAKPPTPPSSAISPDKFVIAYGKPDTNPFSYWIMSGKLSTLRDMSSDFVALFESQDMLLMHAVAALLGQEMNTQFNSDTERTLVREFTIDPEVAIAFIKARAEAIKDDILGDQQAFWNKHPELAGLSRFQSVLVSEWVVMSLDKPANGDLKRYALDTPIDQNTLLTQLLSQLASHQDGSVAEPIPSPEAMKTASWEASEFVFKPDQPLTPNSILEAIAKYRVHILSEKGKLSFIIPRVIEKNDLIGLSLGAGFVQGFLKDAKSQGHDFQVTKLSP